LSAGVIQDGIWYDVPRIAQEKGTQDSDMSDKNFLQTLMKSNKDKWIGGVCGGLGEHTPIPPWSWRFLFSLLFFVWGTGLVLYILLWIFLPKQAEE
jgi:phage shock protein C